MLLEQNGPAAIVYRRTEQGFLREVYTGLGTSIPLYEVDVELKLADVYEAVEFASEPDGAR